MGPMISNPIPSAAPFQPWQGPTQDSLSSQGADHSFGFSSQASAFSVRPDPSSQGAAAQYPQGNFGNQYTSRSGSQPIGNAHLNAEANPVGWNTSTSSPFGTGQSVRTNVPANHDRRPRRPSRGGCSNAFVPQSVTLKPNRWSQAWPFKKEHLGWR